MGKFRRCYLDYYCYFVTSTTLEKSPIFNVSENSKILFDCIYNFRAKGRFLLLAFVIMSTHFHALLVPEQGYSISGVMHSIKRSSSRLINLKNECAGNIWMPSFYEHIIRNKKDFSEKLKYIHNNPVKAGIVKRPEEYKFSSAYYSNSNDLSKYRVD